MWIETKNSRSLYRYLTVSKNFLDSSESIFKVLEIFDFIVLYFKVSKHILEYIELGIF